MSAQDSLDRLRASAAEHKWFFNKGAFFEEGEKTGRLLAKIVQLQQASPAIGAIRNKSGGIVNSPELIVKDLADFYASL